MSRGIILVGSGVELTNRIKDCMDNVIVLGKAGEEVLMEIGTEYTKQFKIEPMPKLEPIILTDNQRGVIPPKYYSRKKK